MQLSGWTADSAVVCTVETSVQHGKGHNDRPWTRSEALEAVHLDGGLRDALFHEEGGDLETLVTLQLDDLAHLLVVHQSPVASEFLSTSSTSAHRS